MSKYIIKNCSNQDFYACKSVRNEDCLYKQIVEKCKKYDGEIVGYCRSKVYDGKKLVDAQTPLATFNPLAQEILDLLQIEEVE